MPSKMPRAPHGAGEHSVGPIIVDELFSIGIPLELALRGRTAEADRIDVSKF